MIARNTSQFSRFKRIVVRTGTARGGAVVHRVRPAPVPINPLITPASTIIVVKKPHTNPARVAITLRTSARFRQSGTLQRTTVPTSGGIHIFRTRTAANEMQFNGTDNVFSASDLTRGVQVFATADRPSGSPNDFQLTLTLTPGPTAGPPVTVSLTAVELTLDVGLSRPSPGVAPPIMSANDKINIGRFVQVRNPNFDHERAMIVLRPPNPQVPLIVRLEALTAQLRAFGFEVPSDGQGAHPRIATFTSDLLTPAAFELFVEATTFSVRVRDTGFRYGVEGVENEVDRVAMTAVQVEVADTANPAVAASTFVRFGLWDHAFRPPGSLPGLLFNEEAEADNFVGADTKKFHLRVRDIAQRTATHVQADWTTLDQSNNNFDAPLNPDITLVATPANSGVFISRGLMLINDDVDQGQATHTGLALPLPNPGLLQPNGQSNHRTRKASMLGSMRVAYRPSAGVVLSTRLPVFRRNPEERLRLPLQIFVLRIGVNPIIGTGPTDPIWVTDLRIIRETYERIGLKVETVVGTLTPTDTVVANAGDSIVVIDSPAGVNPANVSFADETTIGTAHPALGDTIRVFFVRGLTSGNGGETWHDALAPIGDPRRAAVFTIQSTGPYAAAHEVGHALTNKELATSACDPAVAARQHFCAPTAAGNRFQNDQNLMKRQLLGAEVLTGPKRIWDTNDADTVNQFTAMRGSRYKRNF